jgi:histidine phosphotransferase ChpT
LCHDLISPVSAINNGVELIEDIGGDMVSEAMKLIGASAHNAARRLKLFRLAYGRAGSESMLPVKDVRLAVETYLAGGKIALTWPETLALDDLAAARGGLKVLANLILLGEEALAYGGALSVKREEGENACACVLEVAGRSAGLSDPVKAALEGSCPVEDLSPRTIQAYVTGRFAESFGLGVTPAQTDADHLTFRLTVPKA